MTWLHLTDDDDVVGECPPLLLLLLPGRLQLHPFLQHIPQDPHLPLVVWLAGALLPGLLHSFWCHSADIQVQLFTYSGYVSGRSCPHV